MPEGQAVERALQIAALLSTYPQLSMRRDRQAALEGLSLSLPDGIAHEAHVHRDTVGDEMAERLRGFAAGDRPEPLRPPS